MWGVKSLGIDAIFYVVFLISSQHSHLIRAVLQETKNQINAPALTFKMHPDAEIWKEKVGFLTWCQTGKQQLNFCMDVPTHTLAPSWCAGLAQRTISLPSRYEMQKAIYTERNSFPSLEMWLSPWEGRWLL